MVAVLKVYELSGAGAGTDKTSGTVRFKNANNATVDLVDPVVIPSSGDTPSFTKQLQLFVATLPDTQVDDFVVYTDGACIFGTGVSVNASNNGTTYITATRRQIATNDFFAFVVGTPFDLQTVASAAVTATGFCGDILCLQLVVTASALPGQKLSETVTFQYSEI